MKNLVDDIPDDVDLQAVTGVYTVFSSCEYWGGEW